MSSSLSIKPFGKSVFPFFVLFFASSVNASILPLRAQSDNFSKDADDILRKKAFEISVGAELGKKCEPKKKSLIGIGISESQCTRDPILIDVNEARNSRIS